MKFIKIFVFILIFFLLNQQNASTEESIEYKLAFPKGVPLNLRNGPGDFYNIVFILKNKNLGFTVSHRIDNWCFIQISEEYKGWVKCASIAVQKKISFLNKSGFLYRIPGKERIMKIEKNSRVKVLKCGLRWCRISHISKKFINGWVLKKDIFGLDSPQ